MYKRGSYRYVLFGIIFIVLLVGVIAADDAIASKISNLPNETEKFIRGFVQENNNIAAKDINSIDKVDLANPPEEVKIGKVDKDTGVAIYQMNYTDGVQDKKLYVVTYSTGQFKAPLELRPVNAIEYLDFGMAELRNDSTYLETATGVKTSSDRGYVMIDSGSITGISTSLEIVNADVNGKIEITIYKNGENTGLTNIIDTSSKGAVKDFDKQSKGIVTFEAGDVISVHLSVGGDVEYKQVINLVKVELNDQ